MAIRSTFTTGEVLTAADLTDTIKGAFINTETSTARTLGTADAGNLVTLNNNSGGTVTIPTNTTWGSPLGTLVHLINIGTAGSFTVGTAAGVTLNAASATLAIQEGGTLIKTATNTWQFVKGGGLGKAQYSSTTGSPTVTTVSGKTCVQFTGSGSITTTAGLVEVLVVGAGMNAQSGYTWPDARAGGDAGKVVYGSFTLTAGTHTITVGAAATRPTVPGSSSIGTIVSAGGGNGANSAAGGGTNNYGIASSITGSNREYSYINGSSDPGVTDSGYGQASALNTTSGAGNGIVIMLFG